MKVVDIVPGSIEWHPWRNRGVTGSDAAVILGISPYKTPHVLWREKIGLQQPVDIWGNPYVRQGVYLEPRARRRMGQVMGMFLMPMCIELEGSPFRASLDAYIEHKGIPGEIKVPSPKNYADLVKRQMESEVFQMHLPQLQLQMMCSKADSGILFFYNPDDSGDYRMFEVEADRVMHKQLTALGNDFYDCMVQKRPPDLDTQRDYFNPPPELLLQWSDIENQYVSTHTQLQRLKQQADQLTAKLAGWKIQLTDMMGEFHLAETSKIGITRYNKAGKLNTRITVFNSNPSSGPDPIQELHSLCDAPTELRH